MKNLNFLKDVIDVLDDYLKETQLKDSLVVNYRQGQRLQELLGLKIEDKGVSSEKLIAEVKNYLEYSVKTVHPKCNNQLFAGINPEALIAELVATITNTTMATYEMAPVATLIEEKLVQELNKLVGFENGDGLMLTGGSNANLMAIHLARQKKFPKIKNRGNSNLEMCVFVSDQAHYSHQKAMMLMGLGLDNLIKVKSLENGQMDPADLEVKIKECIKFDRIPLLVCSTAGTTVMGAFDPIEQIDIICKKYSVWHHVDGAWGGAVIFSKKHRSLVQGLKKVDSFTFDAHKLLATGIITSFFLTQHQDLLVEANSAGGTTYIFHDYENSEHDTGPKSLQCGRKVDALKMWLTWKSRGFSGLEKIVDDHYENRDYFCDLIKDHSRLKLLFDPEYLNVCFQVIPKDESQDINKYNFDLRFKVVQTGRLMTNFSSWSDGTVFFRQIFANQETKKEDLKEILDIIVELAD